MKILFLHGWQSTPGGLKPTYLKDDGHEVRNLRGRVGPCYKAERQAIPDVFQRPGAKRQGTTADHAGRDPKSIR